MRETIATDGANALIVTSLADVCWLLNMRGEDIAFNPYVYSYVIVDPERVHLFVHEGRVDPSFLPNVEIHDYDRFSEYVKGLGTSNLTVAFDKKEVSYQLLKDIEGVSSQPISKYPPFSFLSVAPSVS